MRATILALIPFIMAVTASVGPAPSANKDSTKPSANPPISEVKKQYPNSEIACCKNKEDIEADGILGNLLAKGLLNNVLGVGDSACAKESLIENLNILGLTKEGTNGVQCAGTTAYCPIGEIECKPIDH